MSYKIVRDGLVAVLSAQGITESNECTDFKNAGTNELENTFILNRLSGEEDGLNERQQAFLYDSQKWNVQIAFSKNSDTGTVQLDRINTLIDTILIKLDNPANWNTFCSILRYKSWKIEEHKSYFVAIVELKILDALTY